MPNLDEKTLGDQIKTSGTQPFTNSFPQELDALTLSYLDPKELTTIAKTKSQNLRFLYFFERSGSQNSREELGTDDKGIKFNSCQINT